MVGPGAAAAHGQSLILRHGGTNASTDMAISGDGFFVVAQPTGFADKKPTFNGVTGYSPASARR